jgi:hypothetical protein
MTDSIKTAMARSLTKLRERTEDPSIRSMIDDVVDGKSSLHELLASTAFTAAFPVPTQVAATAAGADNGADDDDFSAQTYLRRR